MAVAEYLPEVLTIRQAAALLGVHPETLRRWDAQGKLVARRMGPRGARRYAKQDVLRLAHDHEDRMRDAQRIVVDVARTITGSLDLYAIARTVVDAAVRIVQSERCAIYLVDDAQAMFVPLLGVDVHDPASEPLFYAHPVPVDAMPLGRLALKQAEPLVIDDTETHPLSNPAVFRIFNTRTMIAVSMRGGEGRAFGLMTFGWTAQPHLVREDEIFFARSLGALAEVALSNARLFAQREQERARATAIAAVMRDVNSGSDLSDTLTRTISSLVDQLKADEGAIWLMDDIGVNIVGAVETRTHGPTRIGAALSLADSPDVAAVFAQQQPRLVPAAAARGAEQLWFQSLDVQASLFVPLMAQGRVLGMAFVNFLDTIPQLAAADLQFAGVLAAQCALAIERVQLLTTASTRAAELEAVISQMNEGLIMVDRAGRIVLVNQYAAALYGVPEAATDPARFDPQHCAYRLDGTPIPPTDLPVYRAALYGETASDVECVVRRPDGSQSIVSGSASPIVGADGQRLGAVVILQDVTARRRIEAEKDQFLSIVSHELKTPLTTIKGLNELAVRRLTRGVDGAVVLPNLHGVARQVGRMEGLIADVLDIGRLQRGVLPLTCQPVDYVLLVRDAAVRAQATTDRHHIQTAINVAGPLLVYGDQGRLEQVLDNLLSNAIKYSPNGGTIRLELYRTHDQAILRIHDQGIGIPEAGRERLFERFYRGANVEASSYSGLGIGLALSRELVQQHGGTLLLEQTSETGSTFKLCLPLGDAAEAIENAYRSDT